MPLVQPEGVARSRNEGSEPPVGLDPRSFVVVLPAVLPFRPPWLALLAFPVSFDMEEPNCREPAVHQGCKVAKVSVLLRLLAAYLAVAGYLGGDSVGVKVTEKVLGRDVAPEKRLRIPRIVGMNPLDLVRSKGAGSLEQSLPQIAPEVLVRSMLLLGPPASPETIDDLLVVYAYFPVASGRPNGANEGGKLCTISTLSASCKGGPPGCKEFPFGKRLFLADAGPFFKATTDQAHLRSRLSLAKVPPEPSV